MDCKVRGKVLALSAIESGITKTGSEWKKRCVFVEEIDERYPKKVAFYLTGDKCDMDIKEGDVLTVYMSIESREYNGKYYTDAKAYKVEADRPF